MIDFTKMTKWDMGKCFDYAILPKDTTEETIRKECKVAIQYNCKAFCFFLILLDEGSGRRTEGNGFTGGGRYRISLFDSKAVP